MITDEMIEAAAKAIYLKDYAPHGSAARWDRQEVPNDTLIQCRTLARAALTAVLPLLQKDWQPIETAPKGKEVLLFEPAIRTAIRSLSARIVIGSYPTSYPREPTHWLPLPEPPKTKP